jgi:hypothetical protein
LPKNEDDLIIEEKFNNLKISGRIVACPATIHAAVVGCKRKKNINKRNKVLKN